MLDLPGRFVQAVSRRPGPLPAAELTHGELARTVVASPRANAYLSLEPGLHPWKSEDGVLTWAAAGKVAFVVGGVHGQGDPRQLLRAFYADACAAGFRQVLLFPVSADERAVVADAGFGSLMVGAEAFVDPTTFSMSGKAKADLRQMVNRATKRYGLRADELCPEGAAADVGPVYRDWLADRKTGHQMLLLVGRPAFGRPEGRRYFAVHDADGAPTALVVLTPAWSGGGYGVDVMAREPDGPAGAMDLLLTHVIRVLADEGVHTLSLGASPMAERCDPPADDSRLLRPAFRFLYRSSLGNRLFGFESLARYKDKFDPHWEPVYFGGAPSCGVRALYAGCRMWGLFGPPPLDG